MGAGAWRRKRLSGIHQFLYRESAHHYSSAVWVCGPGIGFHRDHTAGLADPGRPNAHDLTRVARMGHGQHAYRRRNLAQNDLQSRLWLFGSWSDGGSFSHTYTVPLSATSVTLSANYVSGNLVTFLTNPPGLPLTVDGRTNWPDYTFAWVAGSKHTVIAPAQDTDLTGRHYQFQSWSNGGSA